MIAVLAAPGHLAVLMTVGAMFQSFAALLEKHSLAAENFASWFHFLVVLGLRFLSHNGTAVLLGSS